MNPPAHRPAAAVLFLLLVLPWVVPLSSGPSRNAWPYLISVACMGGLLLLRRHWRPQVVAFAWLAAALISSAIALLQYLGWAGQLAPWIAAIGPGEGSGNLRQRNQMASLSAIGLICLIYLVGTVRAKRQEGRWPWPWPWPWAGVGAGLILLAAGNAVTSSRTGALAWVGVLAASAWYGYRRRQSRPCLLAAAALALYLCASMLMPTLLEWSSTRQGSGWTCAAGPCNALERLAQSGGDSRIALWHNVIDLIALRPWTGWGWGELDYAHYITLFEGPRFSEKLDNAHNLPLHLAVELGLPAAAVVCMAFIAIIWQSRPWRETRPWKQAAWTILAVIGLHSLLEYPLWYGPFQIALIVCALGLWRGRPSRIHGPSALAPAWHAGLMRRSHLAASALLLGAAVVAFDYHRVSQIYLPAGQRLPAYRDQPLAHAQGSWFFQGHARFAWLALTPLDDPNASAQLRLAQELLHHSPEPLVIERLLDAAIRVGDAQTVAWHSARYRAAYPEQHAKWLQRQGSGASAGPP